MKAIMLIFLGGLFVINVFFRIRLMKLFKEIKKHQLRIELRQLLNKNKFSDLVEVTYPDHAELLNNYRQSMITGLALIILVVLAMFTYLILKPA